MARSKTSDEAALSSEETAGKTKPKIVEETLPTLSTEGETAPAPAAAVSEWRVI